MNLSKLFSFLINTIISRMMCKLFDASSKALNNMQRSESASPAAIAIAPSCSNALTDTASAWLTLARPLVHHFEQCRLIAYWDEPGQVWTCGWGSTGPDICEGTVWTQQQADARCDADLIAAACHIDRAVAVTLTAQQKAALVSLIYNVGPGRATVGRTRGRGGIIRLANGQPSTLLRRLNAGDYEGAANQFTLWNRVGGHVLRGLVRRRDAERRLFLEGQWQ